jgi:hypothetical protein
MFSRSSMQVGAGAGLSGGFRSDAAKARSSIANAPTSMTIRVAHIYRRIDGERSRHGQASSTAPT